MMEPVEPQGFSAECLEPEAPPPEWALVELMGHRQRAGLCQEVSRFGAVLLRIDIYDQAGKLVRSEHYGGAAIFSYTVCTEATAKEAGQKLRDWEAPAPYDAQLRLPGVRQDDDDDDEDEAVADADDDYDSVGRLR